MPASATIARGSDLTGGGGLSVRLDALDADGAVGIEATHHFAACNSCPVGHLQSAISALAKILVTKKQCSQ